MHTLYARQYGVVLAPPFRLELPDTPCECGAFHWGAGAVVNQIQVTTQDKPPPAGLVLSVLIDGALPVLVPIVFDAHGYCDVKHDVLHIPHGHSLVVNAHGPVGVPPPVSVKVAIIAVG
jgi:hypothetical protein